MKYFILFLAVLVIVSACITPQQEQPMSPAPTDTTSVDVTIHPKPACDSSLWSHIYNPSRLKIISACKTVTGTVTSVRKEADGDDHIRLRLDPEYARLINQKNIDGQHGDLVLETICKNRITQEDAKEPCSGFHQDMQVKAGQHIRVTGAYVTDMEHGWNEIHPITTIENI